MEMPKCKETPKNLNCVRTMPELRHSVGDGDFDITKSEVVQWLIRQPSVLQHLFEVARRKGTAEPLIVYNAERGTWRGTDYRP